MWPGLGRDAKPRCSDSRCLFAFPGVGLMPRKAFLLRIDPEVLAAVQRWADEDLRSLNGQIEFILRQALARRGVRLPGKSSEEDPDGEPAARG
jgi:hypothetical protein